ncbi:hypothetical protein Celaphus_00007640 [Cervus elaphus hippelaphus]|uniref:NADP-dependent oxidoreductase domain-containing protein n=1 Tax=Cervus elaphus hippelaphus TaxID=46360 RepID=A0A212CBU5_CEREH|nr:hypothetical protein Celaphus_00007640 [Cervus elaphus hippelaphus]
METQCQRVKLSDGHFIPILGFGTYAPKEALEQCKDAGLPKSIGVSNFNHKQLEKILNKPGLKYKPVCNQLEVLQSPGGGQLLGGEVNVILPSFQVFDFELTPEDMKAIDGLNRNIRYYDFQQRKKSESAYSEEQQAMDPKSQKVKLNDGHFIPVLGFGTYAPEEVPKSEALEATKFAIEIGFRHVDSAHLYQNEEQVGQAIRSKIADGTVKREDIFYTSKLWCTSLRPELVRPALEKSLKNLQLDYVDLYIIHSPVSLKPGNEFVPKDESGKLIFDSVDLCHTWEALEKCKDAGLAKSIGVSNFNHKQLEKILNKPGLKYKPVCNQVECHPYLNQSKLLEFCKSHDIVLVAYAALGSQLLSELYEHHCRQQRDSLKFNF